MDREKPKRAGIYVRVSTLEQSSELQLRELLEFVRFRGWEPIVYDDSGKSGTSCNRPNLKLMMKDARERKIDVVLCWKLDRLFRSLKDLIATLQELTELRVEFISLKDHIDMSTSSGRLMMHLIGAFGEFEASLIRERVRSGLANAKSKGVRLGRPKSRDDTAIGSLRSQGLSMRTIARELGLSLASVQRSIAVSKSSSFVGTKTRA